MAVLLAVILVIWGVSEFFPTYPLHNIIPLTNFEITILFYVAIAIVIAWGIWRGIKQYRQEEAKDQAQVGEVLDYDEESLETMQTHVEQIEVDKSKLAYVLVIMYYWGPKYYYDRNYRRLIDRENLYSPKKVLINRDTGRAYHVNKSFLNALKTNAIPHSNVRYFLRIGIVDRLRKQGIKWTNDFPKLEDLYAKEIRVNHEEVQLNDQSQLLLTSDNHICERLLASGKYIPVDSVQSILDSLLHKDEFDDYTRAQNSAFRLVKYEIKKALFPKEKVEATEK